MFIRGGTQPVVVPVEARDGSGEVTSGATIRVKKEGGAWANGLGTLVHEENGQWQYTPAASETDAEYVTYRVGTGAGQGSITVAYSAWNWAIAGDEMALVADAIGSSKIAANAFIAAAFSAGSLAGKGDWASQVSLDALQASVDGLATGVSTRVRIATAAGYEHPESGSVAYEIVILCVDENGVLTAPDSTPIVTVENVAGTDRSGNLSTITNPSTGRYEATYTVTNGDTLEPLVIGATAAIGGTSFVAVALPVITDAVAEDFTATDRNTLNTNSTNITSLLTDIATLLGRLTDARATKLDRDLAHAGDAALYQADNSALLTTTTFNNALPANFVDLLIEAGTGKVTTANPAAGSGSAHTAQDVVDLLLVNPANKLLTNASGQVEASNMRGTDQAALAVHWTATRAAYIDNLSVGPVAQEITVSNIQNAVRSAMSLPVDVQRPSTGSIRIRVDLLIYSRDAVVLEDPDSNAVTLSVANVAGTSRSGNLFDADTGGSATTSMNRSGVGQFHLFYEVEDTDELEQLRFEATYAENGNAMADVKSMSVVEVSASGGFLQADRDKVNAVYDKLPSVAFLTGSETSDGTVEVQAFSLEAQSDIRTQADNALASYDGPTRNEATSDKNEILGATLNANVIQVLGGTLTQSATGRLAAAITAFFDVATAERTLNDIGDLRKVLGTVFSESVTGQIAAAFAHLFDVETPAKTINDIGSGSGGSSFTLAQLVDAILAGDQSPIITSSGQIQATVDEAAISDSVASTVLAGLGTPCNTPEEETAVTIKNFDPHISGDTWAGVLGAAKYSDLTLIDLTNAEITMTFRRHVKSSTPSLVLTLEAGDIEIVGDPTNGQYRVKSRVIDLSGPWTYVHDVEVTLEPDIYTVLRGTFPVIGDVTR